MGSSADLELFSKIVKNASVVEIFISFFSVKEVFIVQTINVIILAKISVYINKTTRLPLLQHLL